MAVNSFYQIRAELWFIDTGTGNVFLKKNFEPVDNDANGNAVRKVL